MIGKVNPPKAAWLRNPYWSSFFFLLSFARSWIDCFQVFERNEASWPRCRLRGTGWSRRSPNIAHSFRANLICAMSPMKAIYIPWHSPPVFVESIVIGQKCSCTVEVHFSAASTCTVSKKYASCRTLPHCLVVASSIHPSGQLHSHCNPFSRFYLPRNISPRRRHIAGSYGCMHVCMMTRTGIDILGVTEQNMTSCTVRNTVEDYQDLASASVDLIGSFAPLRAGISMMGPQDETSPPKVDLFNP